jgi:hypothetical protein
VQLHDFARAIFVQVAGGVVGIVEISQHRRVAQGGTEQIAEVPHGVGPDRAILVIADQNPQVGFVLMHVEMIEPEPKVSRSISAKSVTFKSAAPALGRGGRMSAAMAHRPRRSDCPVLSKYRLG